MTTLDLAVETLAAQFTAAFPEEIAPLRTVGREAEYPVVTASGTAADVRYLWEPLLKGGDLKPHYDSTTPNLTVGLAGEDYHYELEVGVGTVELVTRPCADLWAVERIMKVAMSRLVRAAATQGWRVLAYGIQPVSPPSLPLMAPKQRYQSLYRAMGAEWLWYTVTASDQCHVALRRGEIVPMLNFGNMMAPVIIALCANSPVFASQVSPFCSAREGQHALIDAHEYRHGMPARPYTSMVDFVRRVVAATYLIRHEDNLVIPNSRPFTDYLAEHGPDFAAFLFHEHYIWNSARLRSTYGTLEIRPACQQPWPQHMAAMALSVGLIEAAQPIRQYVLTALGDDYWTLLRTYHQRTIAQGLNAPQPAPNFLATILKLAEEGLRQRGLGEEQLLTPLWHRLERRQNPAQRARQIFQTDGMHGLLAHATIRPN